MFDRETFFEKLGTLLKEDREAILADVFILRKSLADVFILRKSLIEQKNPAR